MNQTKTVILIFIGFLIVIAAEYRFHVKQSLNIAGEKRTFLRFEQGKLHLNQSECIPESEKHVSIPADYVPLFFQKIPLNQASYQLLQTIPGVGPKTAAQIIQLRDKRGRITDSDELLLIKGIGVKKQKSLSKYLSFE